jgi:hypothetical protein
MKPSAVAGAGTILSSAPLAKSLPELSASEKAFLRVMADTVSGCDSFSLQHVCDLFMYDRALKIESLVRELKIPATLPRSDQGEAQFYLRQFKIWAKQHREELLSEFFICKFSLMQSIASDHPRSLFKPPFFHDLSLLKRRGLVRFLKYDRSPDFPLFLKHVSKSVSAAFNGYIDELKIASQIYSKASISRTDCLSLHEPIFSYFDVYKKYNNEPIENYTYYIIEILNCS